MELTGRENPSFGEGLVLRKVLTVLVLALMLTLMAGSTVTFAGGWDPITPQELLPEPR